jgi:hypothetical protein
VSNWLAKLVPKENIRSSWFGTTNSIILEGDEWVDVWSTATDGRVMLAIRDGGKLAE